jgi:hypothetical protein
MAKNTHLEHLEDDIFNQGFVGAKNAIEFLKSLRDMLSTGSGGSATKVTVKWDGAPAIICGVDPENGYFFVGTKSVFAKTEPKVCYADEDIDLWYPGHPIADKLKQCLKLLPQTGITGVVQGDLLYTNTPPKVRMGGKDCYKFKPNTITYCVEAATDLGKKVAASDLGIVFHTRYHGETLATMNASFGVDVSKMQSSKKVAVFSATFQNTNGVANLNSSERNRLNNSINVAQRNLVAGKSFLNAIQEGKGSFAYTALFKIYFNQVIKSGKIPSSSAAMHREFISFVDMRYKAEIAKKKTDKARQQWEDRRADAIKYLNNNKSVMFSALSGFKNLIAAKEQVINKLKKIQGVGTFLEDENGYRVTSPEGFVAIKDGTAMKLVDRLEFSRANFTVAKDWGK